MKIKQTAAAVALSALSLSAYANLAQVGPVSSTNGFPLWYQDLDGTTLDLCFPNASDPGGLQKTACLLEIDPPYVFPGSFPEEAFYMRTVSSPLTVGSARGILVLALEAAFGTGAPAVGQQTVFTRIRVTTGVPEDGDYTVIHPYGTEFFPDVVSQGANRDIVFTEDVGIAPGLFSDALTSRVGPFLKPIVADASGNPVRDAAGNVIVKPPMVINGANFLSDGGATPELVTGSPFNTNYFMICGKRADGSDIKLGDALADGSGYDAVNGQCARIDTFAVTGRYHDNIANPIGTPITINSATFSRDPVNGTHMDAYVTARKPLASSPTPIVTIAAINLPPVKMIGPNAQNKYYVQGITVPHGDRPGQLTAINSADNPSSSITGHAVDDVIINSANYVSDPTTGVGTLTVVATSSDKGFGATPAPALAIAGYPEATATHTGGAADSALTTLVATLLPTDMPPDTITVQSADGGQETAQVVKGRDADYSGAGVPFVQNDIATVVASGSAITIPVIDNDVANAAAPITGINILAPAPSSGTAVVSGNSIVYTPGAVVTDETHPAPEIRYTANSIAGTSNVGTVTVTVTAPAGGAAPIAVADGPINVRGGTTTVIDILSNDSGNGSALDPATVQVTNVTGGTATVNATGTVTFVAGTATSNTSGFDYTVANASGIRSASARVSVPVINETIAFTKTQCKNSSWRITGTTSVPNTRMTFYRTNTVPAAPTAAQTIGSITADNLGAFDFRGAGSCTTTPTANRMSIQSALGTVVNNRAVSN
jgi:hypothetical protein